jgi:hypothetical protein
LEHESDSYASVDVTNLEAANSISNFLIKNVAFMRNIVKKYSLFPMSINLSKLITLAMNNTPKKQAEYIVKNNKLIKTNLDKALTSEREIYINGIYVAIPYNPYNDENLIVLRKHFGFK